MATIQKDRPSLRQADDSQTSAAIEMHLVHLGAAGTLYEDTAPCNRIRESCARDLLCETPTKSRRLGARKGVCSVTAQMPMRAEILAP